MINFLLEVLRARKRRKLRKRKAALERELAGVIAYNREEARAFGAMSPGKAKMQAELSYDLDQVERQLRNML